MTRGARRRVENGVYLDAGGLAAVVTVRGRQREKRFPPGTDLAEIRVWRAEERLALLKAAPRLVSDRGTLARDIARYLRTRKGRPGYRADRSHFKAWIVAFGPRRRHELTHDEIARAVAMWTVSARTVRHRVRVLRELYTALDPQWTHPVGRLSLPRVPRSTPTPVSHDVIARVAKSLIAGKSGRHGYGWEPVKSRARFFVYATTGQRPAQIGRAQPGDVDLARRIWFVRPAKGGDPIPLPLNEQMIIAWQMFAAADAWGVFDTRSLAKVLRRHGWPAGVRPYKLRHTFAIDLLLADVPLETIQGLLGHVDIRTTRIYAPILLGKMQAAVGKRMLDLGGAKYEVPSDRDTTQDLSREIERKARRPRTRKRAVS
jgi:integrase